MKKRSLLAAALAVLLLFSLCPAALAMGYDLSSFDWLNPSNSAFSLKDYLDGSQESVSISGTPIDLEHLLFAECAVNEELELCLCEISKDARVLDETSLPGGCRVEVRQEKLRRPWDIVEENRRKAQGLSDEPEETPEPLTDDGQEHFYLYLVGRPARLGTYAFLIWSDPFFYCTVEVVQSLEDAQATANNISPNPFDHFYDIPADALQTVNPPANPDTPTVTDTPAVIEMPAVTDAPSLLGTLSTAIDSVFGTSPEPAASTPNNNVSSNPFDLFYNIPLDALETTTPTITPTLTAPTVMIAGSTSCRPGERAVLEARATGENLSYQWYRALGYYTSPIDGATNSYYIPDTSQEGSYGYFCRVTSSAYGQQVYTDSEPVIFTVVERKLTSVSIDTMPSKLSYTEGEALNTSGLRLLLRYDGQRDQHSGRRPEDSGQRARHRRADSPVQDHLQGGRGAQHGRPVHPRLHLRRQLL